MILCNQQSLNLMGITITGACSWRILCELKEYWSIIEEGIPAAAEGALLCEAKKRAIDEAKLKGYEGKKLSLPGHR